MDKTCMTCNKSFYVSPSRGHIKKKMPVGITWGKNLGRRIG